MPKQLALTTKQQVAITLLLRGYTHQKVAELVQADRNTISNWVHDNWQFQRALQEQLEDSAHASKFRVINLTTKALTALSKAMKSDNFHASVQAARTVLQMVGLLKSDTTVSIQHTGMSDDELRVELDRLKAEVLSSPVPQEQPDTPLPPGNELLD